MPREWQRAAAPDRETETHKHKPLLHTKKDRQGNSVCQKQRQRQRALYAVALVSLSKRAQQCQTGSVLTLLSSSLHWPLCSVKETIQPHDASASLSVLLQAIACLPSGKTQVQAATSLASRNSKHEFPLLYLKRTLLCPTGPLISGCSPKVSHER